jgi:hypothetical protein
MATEFCPECHQPLSGLVIAGVRLPKFKARLFQYIQTHPGQSSADLAEHFYTELNSNPAASIRSHIYQINEALLNTAVRIRGDHFAGYYIERGIRGAHGQGLETNDTPHVS